MERFCPGFCFLNHPAQVNWGYKPEMLSWRTFKHYFYEINFSEWKVEYLGMNEIHECLDSFPWGQTFIEQFYNFYQLTDIMIPQRTFYSRIISKVVYICTKIIYNTKIIIKLL